ncbi:hypothetical protein Pfo_005764 [Paulownia fortunei]|nr:hypothetical protein Pfo_005764 [Paulownia fortunei]
MAADPQHASLLVVPIVVGTEVCTVQQEGELLRSTMDRAISTKTWSCGHKPFTPTLYIPSSGSDVLLPCHHVLFVSIVLFSYWRSATYAPRCHSPAYDPSISGPTLNSEFIKNDQKLNPGSVSIQPDRKYSVPDAPGEAKMESRFEEKKVSSENNEPGKHFQDGVKGSGARKTWRVAHRKRGKQEPGFNLDYSTPKTHPPVHN